MFFQRSFFYSVPTLSKYLMNQIQKHVVVKIPTSNTLSFECATESSNQMCTFVCFEGVIPNFCTAVQKLRGNGREFYQFVVLFIVHLLFVVPILVCATMWPPCYLDSGQSIQEWLFEVAFVVLKQLFHLFRHWSIILLL